jgi:hypothetical protein
VAEARQYWKADQAKLDSKKLVFIDETSANTKMVRTYGRAARGQRLIGKQPFSHRRGGITAPWVLAGQMNRDAFLVYLDKVLRPTLEEDDLVMMDNLPAARSQGRGSCPAHRGQGRQAALPATLLSGPQPHRADH